MRILTYVIAAALAVVAFGLASLPLHELGHSLAARILGIGGSITVNLAEFTGLFLTDVSYLTSSQIQFIEAGSFVFPAIINALALVSIMVILKRIIPKRRRRLTKGVMSIETLAY
ncbi:hypothetical protein ES708_28321 [subsurface metagenome]